MQAGFINLQRAIEEGIIKYFANKTGRAVPDIVLSMRVSTRMFVYTNVVFIKFLSDLGGPATSIAKLVEHMHRHRKGK